MDPREAYLEKLTDRRWKHRRWQIIRRDNGRCCNCWSPHRLQIHHLRYLPDGEPWDSPDADLVTLCRKCHERAHDPRGLPVRYDVPPKMYP